MRYFLIRNEKHKKNYFNRSPIPIADTIHRIITPKTRTACHILKLSSSIKTSKTFITSTTPLKIMQASIPCMPTFFTFPIIKCVIV